MTITTLQGELWQQILRHPRIKNVGINILGKQA